MIAQEFARSPSEYLAKIAKRGLSDLVALRDAEFYEGLTRMEEAATDHAGPLIEPVDLGGASLAKANLLSARLKGANLVGADLRGVDLADVSGLTRTQLDSAQVDDRTKLSQDLD